MTNSSKRRSDTRTKSVGRIAILVLSICSLATAVRANGPCEHEMARATRTHGVPLGVLYAVGLSETGRKGVLHPYALNIDGSSVMAADLREAVVRFREARRKGAKLVDLGCMQINHRYHGDKFADVEAMFDPVRNVDYAARFLKELRAREKLDHGGRALQCGRPQYDCAKTLHLQRDRQPGGERLWIVDQRGARLLR
jgi:hypothetical protein